MIRAGVVMISPIEAEQIVVRVEEGGDRNRETEERGRGERGRGGVVRYRETRCATRKLVELVDQVRYSAAVRVIIGVCRGEREKIQ